jgi:hypothetical protein
LIRKRAEGGKYAAAQMPCQWPKESKSRAIKEVTIQQIYCNKVHMGCEGSTLKSGEELRAGNSRRK